MATVTIPARDILQAEDDAAWKSYGGLCWDPRATSEGKARAFRDAMETLERLHAYEREHC